MIKINNDVQNRYLTYNKTHCWQYDIRLSNIEKDLKDSNLTLEETSKLKVSDFTFKCVEDKKEREEIKEFIYRHEWLASLSQYTTHWFACYYKNILAGVVLMNVPNAFSKLLGENTPNLERLISRGACISWSPKNLASSLIMWSINWMAKNTTYRLFIAYSDPTALELGTVYQACNFYYLGKSAGGKRYISPYTGKIISDRFFRQKTAYKKFADELGITWKNEWQTNTGMNWNNVPDDIEKKLREYSKMKQEQSQMIEFPKKHKYAYIIGSTPKETKILRKEFLSKNKIYSYPKERGV
jgi:hypothetical protein